jgi:hypothetical protein
MTMKADLECLDAMSETDGIHVALTKLLQKLVSPQATKAALVTAYYLVTNSGLAGSRLVDLSMVELLVELLVDADKGTTEKALAVLDNLLLTEEGRGKACHVSDMATEFAVSALWRLCKSFSGEGPCKAEALQLGAFHKFLLLQVGCMGVTKERARSSSSSCCSCTFQMLLVLLLFQFLDPQAGSLDYFCKHQENPGETNYCRELGAFSL